MIRHYMLTACILWLISALPVVSQEEARINAIVIEGNQRIDTQTITTNIEMKEGDSLSEEAVDAALKRLYKMGLFKDVAISHDAGTLRVKVQENPMINLVAFEGNKRIKEDVLMQEVRLRPRMVLSKTRVTQDRDRIQLIYQKSGRYAAKVTPKMIELPQNRVNVVFEIDEGPRTLVKKIFFVGNEHVTRSKLSTLILTQEDRWYRFFAADDAYDPDRVAYDKELIERYYRNIGYADCEVTHASAELTPDKQGFYLTFAIHEGARYRFGKSAIDNHIPQVEMAQLQAQIGMKEGAIYDQSVISRTVEDMNRVLSNHGFAFVTITPTYKKDTTHNIVDIVFHIEEAPRYYVRHITIHGNERTFDNVIRREFSLAEGDPYNADALDKAERNLRDLDYFQTISLTKTRVEGTTNQLDVDVAVADKSTGSMNFGVGYSTTVGALAKVTMSESNFLGKGQFVGFEVMRSKHDMGYSFSFTEPRVRDKNLSLGFDLEHYTTKRHGDHPYDAKDTALTLRMGYQLTERLRHTVRYKIARSLMSNMVSNASVYLKEQAGRRVTSLVGHTLYYSTLDSELNPERGYFIRGSQDFAGVGGSVRYVRHEGGAGFFHPILRDQLYLQVTGNIGHIMGWGGYTTRTVDRFFMGGDDIRGFRSFGVGPRDISTDDALGGKYYYRTRVQLDAPMPILREQNFKAFTFLDAGSLSELDVKKGTSRATIRDKDSIRVAAGVGLSMQTTLGDLQLSFGRALKKEKFDRAKIFRITIGTVF